MKRAMIAVAIVLAVLLLLGFVLFRLYVSYHVMDGDNMENPNPVPELLDGPGEVFDWREDLLMPWRSDGSEGYTLEIGDDMLSLYSGGTLVCRKEYYTMTDGIFRLYPVDGESFGEFSCFDYYTNSLQGCIETDGEIPRYISFRH